MSKQLSRLISCIRFPMIVLVVFIHSNVGGLKMHGIVTDEGGAIYRFVHDFVSLGVSACAVPLFFVISGYLFYANVKEWDIHVYLSKLKSRISTLFVPYLFWNTLLILFFFLVQTLIPQMTSGSHLPIAEYGVNDFLMAYWNVGEGSPICGPMWFVRDLMIFSVLTVFLYPIIKRKVIGMVVVILLFFLPSPLCSISFFLFGSLVRSSKDGFPAIMSKDRGMVSNTLFHCTCSNDFIVT